jgi:hypothetical protein
LANELIQNGTTVALSCVTFGAGTYQFDVSSYIDFSDGTNMASTGTGTNPSTSVGISQGNGKYYWRYKYNAGKWSETNSFFLVGTEGTDLALSSNVWVLVNVNDTSETFTFEVQPLRFRISETALSRSQDRNMTGTLLTQFITTKAMVDLDYSEVQYIGTSQKAEFQRFYNMRNDKYLATRQDAQISGQYYYKIWKVEFSSPLQMEEAGELTLSFEEV